VLVLNCSDFLVSIELDASPVRPVEFPDFQGVEWHVYHKRPVLRVRQFGLFGQEYAAHSLKEYATERFVCNHVEVSVLGVRQCLPGD